MVICKGKNVSGGIAVGKIKVYDKTQPVIKKRRVDDPGQELARFRDAVEKAKAQLSELHREALKIAGSDEGAVFEIHKMMLSDPDFIKSIENMIEQDSLNAEYASYDAGRKYAAIFSEMDDEYMKARSADVSDISDRLINILSGNSSHFTLSDEPVILIAQDLSPSETIKLDKEKILAFVTSQGSAMSHTAILARTMNIPALVMTNIEISDSLNGKTAAVDGSGGVIYIDPDDTILKELTSRLNDEKEKEARLKKLKGSDSVTIDGKRIEIYANIGSLDDIKAVLENDGRGIGLFRSEFIYLGSRSFPTEDYQFEIYKKAAEAMCGKKVIIRTLDIGADKKCGYFNIPHEENPALGFRAIRICLTRPEILKTQLRAIYRASAYGNIAVMYPMITSLSEIQKVKRISAEVRSELKKEHIDFNTIEEGIMIETPAAAICSDILAPEVDFFSVGTNDLCQYTLAIDRQNPMLDAFYDPRHPALLRLIKKASDSAHKNGKWIGVCGELGADTCLTDFFLAIGIDELSVSPGQILRLKDKVVSSDTSKISLDMI